MLILGVSDHDTDVQVVGENLTCNSTSNPIPVFASKFPLSTIINFMYESLAYSAVTDTLVACGGMAASQVRDCYSGSMASLKFSLAQDQYFTTRLSGVSPNSKIPCSLDLFCHLSCLFLDDSSEIKTVTVLNYN